MESTARMYCTLPDQNTRLTAWYWSI